MNRSDSSELQVAIVTGAGQGIGRAIAHRLARDGFAVAVVDINATALNSAKEEIEVIWSRMIARKEHYLKPHMLESQFEALEEPANALTIVISSLVDEILSKVLEQMK